MKKLLAALATAVLGLGLAVVAVAAPASAHDATFTPSCSSLTINLTNYSGSGNHLSVKVDSATVVNESFGSSDQKTVQLTPSNVAHSYDVEVTASDSSQYNHSYVGSTTPCLTTVAPVAPKVVLAKCGVDGSVTPVATTGVVYTLTRGDGKQGLYTITATPAAGYTFSGAQSVDFSGDLGTFGTCAVIPTDPTVTPQTCDLAVDGAFTSGFITVVGVTGVTYTIHNTADGASTAKDITVASGNTDVAPGSYLVTAEALTGFTLKSPLSVALTVDKEPTDCQLITQAFLDGSVTAIQPVCNTSGGTTGYIQIDPTDGLTYSINGVQLTAAKTAKPAGSYTVTAVAPPGDAINGPSSWTVVIKAATAICGDLTTLAFTGYDGYAGYLAVAALVLAAGGVFIARSRAAKKARA